MSSKLICLFLAPRCQEGGKSPSVRHEPKPISTQKKMCVLKSWRRAMRGVGADVHPNQTRPDLMNQNQVLCTRGDFSTYFVLYLRPLASKVLAHSWIDARTSRVENRTAFCSGTSAQGAGACVFSGSFSYHSVFSQKRAVWTF